MGILEVGFTFLLPNNGVKAIRHALSSQKPFKIFTYIVCSIVHWQTIDRCTKLVIRLTYVALNDTRVHKLDED